uniref:E3 ubiquitin-protein ligase RING1-like n=1 Tax=Erigeron canadensis TaxID=72917 RepID=UPI001CB90DBD|nr:E3 ubiquitin-protein ligase RING1-like [Erigeron canadensis]
MAEVQHHENEHNDHHDLVLLDQETQVNFAMDMLNRETLVNFVMDMLHQSVEQLQFHSSSPLRIPDPWSQQQNEQTNEHEDLIWDDSAAQIDDRETLNMDFVSQRNAIQELDEQHWEILLNAHNFETNQDLPDYNQNDYEIVFGHFGETNVSNLGHPPASIIVVQNLLSVVVTNEEVENDNEVCAVCKDEIVVGMMAKKLPCAHWYHGDCILPWLEITNTCPICRYELATDNLDYERKKAERAARG